MPSIVVDSMSHASDRGYRALADLADAASGLDYRVVGGHMVQLLLHVYPTELAVKRGTSDADGGINQMTAAGLSLHNNLLERGYTATSGNHYVRDADNELMEVDLLVPKTPGTGRTEIHGGRTFDAIPGLALALSAPAIELTVNARLLAGSEIEFTVPIPGIEAALIMKAMAMATRDAAKDLTDLCSLLEMAHEHMASLNCKLDQPHAVAKGHRKDGARALYNIVALADTERIQPDPLRTAPARIAALIRYVAEPPRS